MTTHDAVCATTFARFVSGSAFGVPSSQIGLRSPGGSASCGRTGNRFVRAKSSAGVSRRGGPAWPPSAPRPPGVLGLLAPAGALSVMATSSASA